MESGPRGAQPESRLSEARSSALETQGRFGGDGHDSSVFVEASRADHRHARLDHRAGFGLRLGVLVRPIALILLLSSSLVAGCARRERREWRVSDHAQPPGVSASAPGPSAAPTAEVARLRAGAALFLSRCASCHGSEGRGDGPGAPPMARPADLRDPAWQAARSDSQIADVIRTGRGMMPGFGSELEQAGIVALVAHVRSLAAAPAAAP